MARAEADHPCQIYLAMPADADTGLLARLLDGDSVAALLLYCEGEPPEAVAREVVATAHARRLPVLLADTPELGRKVGADGVHIPANEERYAACRKVLGAEAIIGAGCGTSRHDALVLGELGADYVAFGPEPGRTDKQDVTELVSWWQEVCEPPVVGWHSGGWEEAAALIDAGADFIGVSALIWDAKDPEAALDQLNSMIAERQRGTT
ncbi:thiamine phosphate synthase [Dichotomicrobium thermohalophilum]|uniref:Thiamine-phosphate pyrophosphorylase n=1 Tax=Dichotomicrobium thermohalophilum TaxID=933063 RepID=A0A397Q323_9HYPH|nr:thiamine phosphate synthase [Dichotomicrobium thermohalophilum]RIA55448.1 thiamine-phosphate pyrophosphorylase [Dichotomicrobium thermohalophilum]